MPFKNFYSGSMLWDNSMANTGAEWTRKNPSGLLGVDSRRGPREIWGVFPIDMRTPRVWSWTRCAP